MAVIGFDYRYSTEVSVCRQAGYEGRLKTVLLYSVLAIATAILPAQGTLAADAEPETAGSAEPPSYQRDVAKEAEEFRPSEITEDGAALVPQATEIPATGDSDASATPKRDRLDQVKAAVREALGETPSDTDPVDSRRQRIQELVVNSPVPEDLKEDRYVGELRDEVSQTIVVQGATDSTMQESPLDDKTMASEGHGSYRVQLGDSLWKISETVFGNGHEWKAIYEANRESLENADFLLVGQRLRIPNR